MCSTWTPSTTPTQIWTTIYNTSGPEPPTQPNKFDYSQAMPPALFSTTYNYHLKPTTLTAGSLSSHTNGPSNLGSTRTYHPPKRPSTNASTRLHQHCARSINKLQRHSVSNFAPHWHHTAKSTFWHPTPSPAQPPTIHAHASLDSVLDPSTSTAPLKPLRPTTDCPNRKNPQMHHQLAQSSHPKEPLTTLTAQPRTC